MIKGAPALRSTTPVEWRATKFCMADAEDAAEDEEITCIARDRRVNSGDIPLADLPRRLGVDVDEL